MVPNVPQGVAQAVSHRVDQVVIIALAHGIEMAIGRLQFLVLLRIINGQRGLRGKGRQQAFGLRPKTLGGGGVEVERAQHRVATDQRHAQHPVQAALPHLTVRPPARRRLDIAHVLRMARGHRLTGNAVQFQALGDVEGIVNGGLQNDQRLLVRQILPDGDLLRAKHRPHLVNDLAQHLVQVQGGADDQADIAQLAQLFDLPGQGLIGATQQLAVVHRNRHLVGESTQVAPILLADELLLLAVETDLQHAELAAGRGQRRKDAQIGTQAKPMHDGRIESAIVAVGRHRPRQPQAARGRMLPAAVELGLSLPLRFPQPAHTRGHRDHGVAVVKQVEIGKIAAQGIAHRLQYAVERGAEAVGVEHGLADLLVRVAHGDVFDRAGRMAQEAQQLWQLRRQPMPMVARLVVFDRHQPNRLLLRHQRGHQAHFGGGCAPQGIIARAKRARLHRFDRGVVEIDVLGR